jgi:hypothetical protein
MRFMIVLLTAVVWTIKQRRMRRTERVASVGVGDEKCTQCFWWGRGEGNKSLGILRLNGFRRIFKKQDYKAWNGLMWVRIGRSDRLL